MAACVRERAHAKINLSLAIHGRRSDGYHELSSLVAFAADIFDVVTLSPAGSFELELSGPFAGQLDGHSNLIETSYRLAGQTVQGLQAGQFHLEKNIPIASGVGGGSADAAAALRALARLNGLDVEHDQLIDIAPEIGADVPVCLTGGGCQAAFMQGVGEQVFRRRSRSFWPDDAVYAVLVNPGVEVSTAEVFRRLAAPVLKDFAKVAPPDPFDGLAGLLSYLETTHNDMEPAAIALAPVIGDVLQALRDSPDCQLARMSGSGATCFGLFASAEAAEQARQILGDDHQDWWVAASRLV